MRIGQTCSKITAAVPGPGVYMKPSVVLYRIRDQLMLHIQSRLIWTCLAIFRPLSLLALRCGNYLLGIVHFRGKST